MKQVLTLEEAYKKYSKKLIVYSRKFLNLDKGMAEEIVQNVFLKLYSKNYSFEHVGNVKAFLYTSCRNEAINLTRDRKKDLVFEDMFKHSAPDEYARLEAMIDIESHIDSLPKVQRKVFEKIHVEGDTLKEVAFDLECPYDTAKANLRHAMDRMKREMMGKKKRPG